MNKWLRRLWFVNGIIVLIGGSLFTYQLMRSYFRSQSMNERGPIVGERLLKAASDSLALQDISMTLPASIGNTSYRFIQFIAKDLTEPTPVGMRMYMEVPTDKRLPDYTYENNVLSGGTINLLFVKSDGSDPHLLLDKKGFIATADIPNERDTVQKFSVYRLVFEDTDNDGRLTRLDQSSLWCSDLDGRNLRLIMSDSLRIVRYAKSLRENRLYIQARVRPAVGNRPEVDWPERIYVFDLRTNILSPFVASTNSLEQVRRQLWTK